ncbi:MAG: glycosyltransferase family 2 protein [Syntrophobacteraceae bacterium]
MVSISVVIPTYNRAKCIRFAIDSALNQSYQPKEVIVIDDGSSDDTASIIEAYGEKVRYIYQTNSGVSSARNLGIRNAQSEWIAFLDSDDEWLPTKLELQARHIESNPEIILHATNAHLNDESADEADMFSYIDFHPDLKDISAVLERPFPPMIRTGFARPPCVMVRRDALIAAGLFDEQLTIYEDLDLMLRVALLGPWGVSLVPLVKIIRRDDDLHFLSRQRYCLPLRARRALVHLYRKARDYGGLGNEERRLVLEALSSSHRALGNQLLLDGKIREARQEFALGLREWVSVASVVKYAVSFVPSFAKLLVRDA